MLAHPAHDMFEVPATVQYERATSGRGNGSQCVRMWHKLLNTRIGRIVNLDQGVGAMARRRLLGLRSGWQP